MPSQSAATTVECCRKSWLVGRCILEASPPYPIVEHHHSWVVGNKGTGNYHVDLMGREGGRNDLGITAENRGIDEEDPRPK